MAAPATPLRFLVVDDDEDMRDVLGGFVERLGHRAHLAADGVEAVEALALDTYDYMLLDLSMPRMSGEDVLRWLRAHPHWGRGLRVIVVSGWARPSALDRDAIGAHAVITKPLRFEQLRGAVAALRPADAGGPVTSG